MTPITDALATLHASIRQGLTEGFLVIPLVVLVWLAVLRLKRAWVTYQYDRIGRQLDDGDAWYTARRHR